MCGSLREWRETIEKQEQKKKRRFFSFLFQDARGVRTACVVDPAEVTGMRNGSNQDVENKRERA